MPARQLRRLFASGLESLEGRTLLSAWGHHSSMERPAQVGEMPTARPHRATADRWAWLADTYWYVPRANLAAVSFNASTGLLVPVSDQTVYHISGYNHGYFWGETVAQFDSARPTSASLVGSVTPEGKVLLHFTSGSNTTEGFGSMTRKGGRWTMENQMFSGSSTNQIGHWAYMAQTRPGMRSWHSLPSAGVSVPRFLSNYSEPTPTPIGG